MAAASTGQSLNEKATCSLCQEFYIDPVTIKCKDNFCRSCITEHWKGAVYFIRCPKCRALCDPNDLTPNRALLRMAELVRQRLVQPETPREQPLCQEHLELQNMEEQGRQRPLQPGKPRGEHLCEEHLELLKGARKADLKPSCPVCILLAKLSADTPKPQTEADADPEDDRSTQTRSETNTIEASNGPPKKQNDGTPELRLALIGSTGAGKSATGNSILGRREFVSRGSAVPVTRQCQRGEGARKDRRLVVVDTPSFLSFDVPADELSVEMEWCKDLSSPGPHAFLLVLQAGRFTEEERESVQTIQGLFGKEALQFTVIVFTRKDDLEGETLQTFLNTCEEKLKVLVKSCGNRVCAFNNRATGADREGQVQELIQIIDTMVEGDWDRYYRLEQNQVAQGQDQVARGQDQVARARDQGAHEPVQARLSTTFKKWISW